MRDPTHELGSFIAATAVICIRELLTLCPFPFFFPGLMRKPLIEDKAADHALFCKYAGELLQRVTGKKSMVGPSVSNISKVFLNFHILCGNKHLFLLLAGHVLSYLRFFQCIAFLIPHLDWRQFQFHGFNMFKPSN